MPASRRALPALLLAIAMLIPALTATPASAHSGKASTKSRTGKALGKTRIGISQRRELGARQPCAALRQARFSKRGRLRRLASRRQRCQKAKAPATASAAPVSLYWGASIGDQLTGEQAPWDMGAVAQFEAMAGKSLSLIHIMAPFADCSSPDCSFFRFPTDQMESIRSHGSIPFFSWSSQSIPSSLNEPDFQLADVIAGTYDDYIREWATAARDWGHPFFLRFDWEMNGNWFPWSEGVNGNQPGEYVAAWRHVHDIFSSVGASNVSWVWCPNIDPNDRMQNLGSLYPGDEYVDWTSLDGYNWGTNPVRPERWHTFDQLYGSTYRQVTGSIAPTKPMVIGEVGSTEAGGSKATWIEEMLAELPTQYPQIRGMLWFDQYDDGMDWPIETSSSATSAFATGIQRPSYLGAEFADIGSGKVPVPR